VRIVISSNMRQLDRTVNRERVSAHRERVRAAGRIYINTDLPADLVNCLDKIKAERGLASRAQLMEEVLKAFVENEMRA
jgi:hypothetical protein